MDSLASLHPKQDRELPVLEGKKAVLNRILLNNLDLNHNALKPFHSHRGLLG